jgi:hypothetical protein
MLKPGNLKIGAFEKKIIFVRNNGKKPILIRNMLNAKHNPHLNLLRRRGLFLPSPSERGWG